MRRTARRPDLLLTDVIMPIMDGPEMLEKLPGPAGDARHPGHRADRAHRLAHARAPVVLGVERFLPKPYTLRELAAHIGGDGWRAVSRAGRRTTAAVAACCGCAERPSGPRGLGLPLGHEAGGSLSSCSARGTSSSAFWICGSQATLRRRASPSPKTWRRTSPGSRARHVSAVRREVLLRVAQLALVEERP